MKKLFLVLALILSVAMAQATPVLIISQKPTLSWNAVTTDVNGNALPSGATVTYTVLWQPVAGGTATTLATGLAVTTYAPTLAAWQFYDLGVRADMVYQGTTISSAVDWGSVGGTPSPFTLLSGAAPASASNLKIAP